MSEINTYVTAYGDKSFVDMPFNEIDNLVFSQLVYISFDGIVDGFESDRKVKLVDARNEFFTKHNDEYIDSQISIVQKSAELLALCANTVRYSNVKLSKYVNNVNVRIDKQFSAINFFLDDGTVLIAFRGTDTSLTGIKESAMLSYMFPVPAQIEALYYFQETAALADCPVRVCGHSKGGNLAVFAAVSCSNALKRNIIAVYENDAPGFPKEFLSRYDYLEIKDRLFSIIPESSIIGCMLEHDENTRIVKSENDGIKQHQVSSWQIEDMNFVYSNDRDESSKFIDKYLKRLTADVGAENIESLFDTIFDFFEDAGIAKYEDLKKFDIVKLIKAIDSMKGITEEERHIIEDTLKLAVKDFSHLYLTDKLRHISIRKSDAQNDKLITE